MWAYLTCLTFLLPMFWKFLCQLREKQRSSQFYSCSSSASSKIQSSGRSAWAECWTIICLHRYLPTPLTDSAVPPHVQWQQQVRILNATCPTWCDLCHSLVAQHLQKKSSSFRCTVFPVFYGAAFSSVTYSWRDLLIVLMCFIAMTNFCFDKYLFWSW